MKTRRSGFAERLTQARKAKGWSMRRLALEVDIRPCNVCNWENDVCLPNIVSLIAIAEVLEISTDWLLGLTKE